METNFYPAIAEGLRNFSFARLGNEKCKNQSGKLQCKIKNFMNLKNIKLNKKLLRKNQVGLVVVFGSQIYGGKHPGSDVDIGIVFEDEKIKIEKPVEVYGDLYEVFSKAFKVPNPDIVYLREAPLSFQFKAVNEGKVIYETSLKFFADYKEEVMIKYFDFKFTEDYFNKIFLSQKYDEIRAVGYRKN